MSVTRAAKYLSGTDLGKVISGTDTDGYEFSGTLDTVEHYGGGIRLIVYPPSSLGTYYITNETPVTITGKASTK